MWLNYLTVSARSSRTDLDLLQSVCKRLDYEAIAFESADESGKAFYHTNVMMWIGTKVAAVCLESIRNKEVRSGPNDLSSFLNYKIS